MQQLSRLARLGGLRLRSGLPCSGSANLQGIPYILQLKLQQSDQPLYQDSTAYWSWHAACVHSCSNRGFSSALTVVGQYVQSWDDNEKGPIDPFAIAEAEIDSISERLRQSLLTDIPALGRAAEYFFQIGAEGKRLRPTMLVLMASAFSAVLPSADLLIVDPSPVNHHPVDMRRRQQRIAEITEMIHVASLLHDDVIDNAETRRGMKALNSAMGNKIAILAGDFLLARASVSLASLRNTEVIELLSQVIEHLVSGEILQMTSEPEELLSIDHYIKKTFYKTASLMANSCKAVAILGNQPREDCQLAWEYGRHLGLAFQFIDDVLDFTSSSGELGKPNLNDIKSGVVTAPVLFAAEEHSELVEMIQRKFKGDGDVARANELVFDSRGIQRTRNMADEHCKLAADTITRFSGPQSAHARVCRRALTQITNRVLTRSK
ncbi:hypothetical protein ABBQ32_004017 [Trebouxia sp. C0010 RCD-2024]